MKGHTYRRGKTFTYVIDVGTNEETGRRRQSTMGGFKTDAAAARAMRAEIKRVEERRWVAPSKGTLGAFLLDEWLPAMRAVIRANTWAMYRMNITAHIIPALGDVPLQSLTAARLNVLYADMLDHGRRSGRGGLSPRTVRIVHAIIRRALKDAVKWDLATRNVADLADPPTSSTPDMRVWSPTQLRQFLDHARDHRLYPAFHLLITTGMRRSEVAGLRWAELDLDAGRLSVTQTLTTTSEHKLTFAEPKTKKSRRALGLDAATVKVLRAHRARQAEERLAAAAVWQDHGLVFCHEDGSPVNPESVSKLFGRLVATSGLPRITLHALRHSYATAALVSGVPTKALSERLGHSTTAVTSDIYQHVTPEMDAAVAARVAGIILDG